MRYHINMKKVNNRLKQTLILEYINIRKIATFLNTLKEREDHDSNLYSLSDKYTNLCTIYEKLFFRFDMLDLSFSLLKRELKTKFSSEQLKFFNLPDIVKILTNLYNDFYIKICDKIEHFTFNEFEKYYLLST